MFTQLTKQVPNDMHIEMMKAMYEVISVYLLTEEGKRKRPLLDLEKYFVVEDKNVIRKNSKYRQNQAGNAVTFCC